MGRFADKLKFVWQTRGRGSTLINYTQVTMKAGFFVGVYEKSASQFDFSTDKVGQPFTVGKGGHGGGPLLAAASLQE